MLKHHKQNRDNTGYWRFEEEVNAIRASVTCRGITGGRGQECEDNGTKIYGGRKEDGWKEVNVVKSRRKRQLRADQIVGGLRRMIV
jgi:hypothetical protein